MLFETTIHAKNPIAKQIFIFREVGSEMCEIATIYHPYV
jgi:hypothetical protein